MGISLDGVVGISLVEVLLGPHNTNSFLGVNESP